jgi:hypothetical protein
MAIHKIGKLTISTENVYPPIPTRNHDWIAIDDDTYDGEGCPIGWGATEKEAISDLLFQLEWYEEEPDVDRLRDDRDERRRLAKESPDNG